MKRFAVFLAVGALALVGCEEAADDVPAEAVVTEEAVPAESAPPEPELEPTPELSDLISMLEKEQEELGWDTDKCVEAIPFQLLVYDPGLVDDEDAFGDAFQAAVEFCKTLEEPELEAEPEPDLTVSQEQAVGKAKSYLDVMAFSRTGLIDQLVFEGFSKDDATFAVDHIEVNWKEQAAQKAEDYLDSMNFSRSGLIEQLLFEGFTQDEAEYGVNQTGL